MNGGTSMTIEAAQLLVDSRYPRIMRVVATSSRTVLVFAASGIGWGVEYAARAPDRGDRGGGVRPTQRTLRP